MPVVREAQGEWNCVQIWYRLPSIKSKQICYTFPGTSEVCVIGDNYNITSTNHLIPTGPVTGTGIVIGDGGNPSDGVPYYGLKFDFNGTLTLFNSCANSNYYCFKIDGEWYNPGNLFHSCGSPQYAYQKSSTKIYLLQYTINIKDINGTIIHTATGNSNPSVRIIGSDICGYENWMLSHEEFLSPSEEVFIQNTTYEKEKRIFVFIRKTIGKLPGVPTPQLRLALYQSAICNYPQVQIKPCYRSDKKCPPNTCYECNNNGYKCCYDRNLNLIKSIKL